MFDKEYKNWKELICKSTAAKTRASRRPALQV